MCNEIAANASHAHPRTRSESESCVQLLFPEQRLRKDHPLRSICTMVDEILRQHRRHNQSVASLAVLNFASFPISLLQQVPGIERVTVGGDKGFDITEFVRECPNMRITPYVAQNLPRRGGSTIVIEAKTLREIDG